MNTVSSIEGENPPKAVCARADFSHWSKAAYWTIPEAVALLFGEDPDRVQRHIKYNRYKIQTFANNYDMIHDLAKRAVISKQLPALVSPGVFLAWAQRNKIDYPPELERQVLLNGQKISDWQSSYESLRQQYCEKEREIAILTQCRDDLVCRVSDLEWQVQQTEPKPLGTRERDSVMKLVIGMAIRGYGYNPLAARNKAIGEICSDLADLGIALDPDTVRKWLQEAAELLPRQGSGSDQMR
jgi:hypothetical protein